MEVPVAVAILGNMPRLDGAESVNALAKALGG